MIRKRYLQLLYILVSSAALTEAVRGDYWQLPVPAQGDAPAGHHALTHDLSAQSCGLCHQDKYKEWQHSLHAKAMSKGLAGQMRSTKPQSRGACLACHLPRTEQWLTWKAGGLSAIIKLHGIDCASCHVRTHKRYGPRDVANTPHGTVQGLLLFESSQFCIKCHQFPERGLKLNGKLLENTYREWRASSYGRAGQTCQSCHMPGGKHEFKGIHDPAMTRKGLKVEVTRKADGVYVRAWNAGAGHALPTYTTPRITITVQTNDKGEAKKATHVIQRQVDWHPQTGWKELSDTRLMPGESVDLMLPLAAKRLALVSVDVQPDADYHDRIYPMLLSAPWMKLSERDRALLEAARDEGINNEYKLYRFKCGPWNGKEKQCGKG